MGCDIHCYIEYRREGGSWDSFGGEISPGRCYDLFELLAGVRGSKEKAVVPPRGMPGDPAFRADLDHKFLISTGGGDGHTTPEMAARYVKDCGAKYIMGGPGVIGWVTNPDFHTHSWLTVEELREVLIQYHRLASECPEYHAMLAAMMMFERSGCESRLVFWFDN